MRLNLRACLLLLVVQQAPAQAQSDATAADDFFADSPLILTVARMAKPLMESPASVSVIDRQMIEASGLRDIAELFRLVPGFVVGFHSGHSPVVTYQGLGEQFGRQIQVLIDGRSVFIPSFGGVPWSNLPLLIEDIERIEVIRGPNAVTYGANAFLATINIITRHAAEDLGTQYSMTASDNTNPDIEDAYLRIGHHHGIVDWRLSLGSISDEGFAGLNDSKRIAKINFRMDLLARRNQFLTLQLGTSDSRAGRGFPPSSSTSLTDIERSEEAINGYFNLQWEAVWDSSTSIARLTHTRQEVTDNYDPGPITISGISGITTFIDFDRTSDRTDLEFIQTDDIGRSLRVVYGGSIRRDKVKSLFLLNDNSFHEVDTGRFFGELEWRFADDWLLDLGIMFEDSDLTALENSPRVSLIRKFGSNHALRLVASAAKRNPILYESEGKTEFTANNVPLFGTVVLPTFIGNDEIEPEEIESYEIGLHSQLAAGLESDIKLFTYEITNHIIAAEVQVPIPGFGIQDVTTAVNGESTEVTGIEVGIGYAASNYLDINAGFSLISADSTFDKFENSFPDHSAFISAQYRISQRHEVSGTFYYLDKVSWQDSADDIPLARRLDLRYAYHLNNELNLEIIGQNLLEDYEDYNNENIHDQVIFLQLSGGF